MILWQRFVLLLAIFVDVTFAVRSCQQLKLTPNTRIESCSNSNNAFSVCTIGCVKGFEIVTGDKRQICWCIGDRCSWQGFIPTCKVIVCPKPDYTLTKIRHIDSWDGGFAHLIEFESLPRDLTSNWGMLVAFTTSLGETTEVKAWNNNLIKAGEKKYLLKSSFTKPDFRNLFADKHSPRCLITVNDASGVFNFSRIFVGLYRNMTTYDDCFDPPTAYVMNLPSSAVIDKLPCPKSKVNPTSISVLRPIFHKTPVPDATTTIATTRKPTTTVVTKIPTLKKLNGMSCKKNRGEKVFGTTATWSDEGFRYYSGNVVVNTHKVLSDWKILVVFNSIIGEVEVWDSEVEQYTDSGYMWTFGPNSWNTILDVGEYDISFVAKELTTDGGTPNATVYLCSKSYAVGDKIITKMPGRSIVQPIALAKPDVWNILVPTKPQVMTTKRTRITKPQTTLKPLTTPAGNRCSESSPAGIVQPNAPQTTPDNKPATDGTKYNYNQVLHLSLLYYEAQRSGYLPSKYKSIPWRGHSALKDGCEIGADLSKGWFDAGDHMKFNFPMAFSVTTLAWGGITFRDAYKNSGELNRFISSIRWPVQYLIACHISKNELVAQVGNPALDHMFWGRPEEMRMRRPTYKLTWQRPGSDLAGETAAALAAASIALKKTHKKLSYDALKHAKELFTFADTYRGKYDDSVKEAKKFYKSTSGYEDELLWAAAWLYRATGKPHYLTKAIDIHRESGGRFTEMYSWDDKMAGAHLLLANLTGEAVYRDRVVQFVDRMMNLPKTPQGQIYYDVWGPNRYTANVAFIALVAFTLEPPLPKKQEYFEFAEKQINLLLGDGGRSYVVGFGKKYPTQYHHRSSSCPSFPKDCNRNIGFMNEGPNHYTLYGALVGGPDRYGRFEDLRSNVKQSETACDYNAGFQSAVAGLKYFAMKPKTHD